MLIETVVLKQAGCDSVITGHSNRHKANAAHSNYREIETQENGPIASRIHGNLPLNNETLYLCQCQMEKEKREHRLNVFLQHI